MGGFLDWMTYGYLRPYVTLNHAQPKDFIVTALTSSFATEGEHVRAIYWFRLARML